jgi:hypothetical protein
MSTPSSRPSSRGGARSRARRTEWRTRCALVIAAFAVVACGKPILRSPVSASAGAWRIDTVDVWDGPNEYGTASRRYQPEEGTRFLWVVVELTNTTAQKRRFNWDRCDLDHREDGYLPALVIDGAHVTDRVEVVDPSERLERYLVFSYPENTWPTRMRCGDVVLALDLKVANAD